MTDPTALPAHTLVAAFRARTLSPVELVDAVAARIEATADLNAFWHTRIDAARAEAVRAEEAYGRGDAGPLEGVPVAVKDLIDTGDEPTTYGTELFRDHRPQADADCVAALRRAGAIVVGKTATHELAFGITTANDHFGPTRNPHARDRIPGGSSGGSGAAVGGGIVPIALGTDTGGSVRIPATFCGCVGIRPTHGAIATAGTMPLAPSMDGIGPLARDVADARLALDVLVAGAPGRARLAAGALPDRPLRIGVIADAWSFGPGPAMAGALETAQAALREAGCAVEHVEIDGWTTTGTTYADVALIEARREHGRIGIWPARRDVYGADVRGRLDAAEHVTLDAYLDAQLERTRLHEALAAVLRRVDVLLAPAAAVTAVPIEGCNAPLFEGREVPLRDLVLVYTAPQSLTGTPGVSVPVGRDGDGLPTGVQISGAAGDDRLVLHAAGLLERVLDG